MGKMKKIVEILGEYEENLHCFGHGDSLVQILKRELLSTGLEDVKTLVQGIDLEFDMLVFNNQTEGRF